MRKKIKNIIDLHSNFKAITTGKPSGGSISLNPDYFSSYPRIGKNIVKKELSKKETFKPEKQVKSTRDLSLDDWEKVGQHLKKLYREDTKTFSYKDLDNNTKINYTKEAPTQQEQKTQKQSQTQKYKPITQKKEGINKKPQVQQQQQPNTQKQPIIQKRKPFKLGTILDSPYEEYVGNSKKSALNQLEKTLTRGEQQGKELAKKREQQAKTFNDIVYGPTPKTLSKKEKKEKIKENYKVPEKINSTIPQIGFLRNNTIENSTYEYSSKTYKEQYLEENRKNAAKAEEYRNKKEADRKQAWTEDLKKKQEKYKNIQGKEDKQYISNPLNYFSWESLKNNPLDFTPDKEQKRINTLIDETNKATKYLNNQLKLRKISEDEYYSKSLQLFKNTFPLYRDLVNTYMLGKKSSSKNISPILHKMGIFAGNKNFTGYDGYDIYRNSKYEELPNYNEEVPNYTSFLPQFPYTYLPLTKKIKK